MTKCVLYVQEMNGWSSRVIPRLIDQACDTRELVPHLWTVDETAEFLRVNDCGSYTDSFISKVSQL